MSVLLLLQIHGRLSAAQLAARLEVSVRTVHRDIEHLSAAGVPVFAVRGSKGGFQLLPGWHEQLAGLTTAEADALTLSALPSVVRALGLAEDLERADLKLSAARYADQGALRDRLHIDPSRWFFREDEAALLPLALHATLHNVRLRLSYRRQSGVSTRTVDPLGVVLKAGVWYLVAGRRDRPGAYRLSRVEAAEITGEHFRRPDDFDLAASWATIVTCYEASMAGATARVRATAAALYRLASNTEAIARSLPMALRSAGPDDWVTATIPLEATHEAHTLLLAPDIEVLAPTELRDALRAAATATARHYEREPRQI